MWGIMLISFLALIGLLNGMLGGLHNWLGGHHIPIFPSISLNVILGFLFAPVAWLIGIPWHSAHLVGNLLGTRTVTNELVAYALLGAQKSSLDFRSFTIATFALCGFANLGSIGMQIGGIGALAPNRRKRPGPIGIARDARRYDGEPNVGCDRFYPAALGGRRNCRSPFDFAQGGLSEALTF